MLQYDPWSPEARKSLHITAGMGRLDMVYGGRDEWAREIDVTALDMSSGNRCILGQLCGSYLAGMAFLGIINEDGYFWGFDGNADDLTAEWISVLERLGRSDHASGWFYVVKRTGAGTWKRLSREYFRSDARRVAATERVVTEDPDDVRIIGPAKECHIV